LFTVVCFCEKYRFLASLNKYIIRLHYLVPVSILAGTGYPVHSEMTYFVSGWT